MVNQENYDFVFQEQVLEQLTLLSIIRHMERLGVTMINGSDY